MVEKLKSQYKNGKGMILYKMAAGIDIECNHMNFSYQKDRKILHNINLSIQHGESLGLIGANGVGKSTFLKLLVGLLTGYEGEIYIQGQAVVKKNLIDIRRKIGYVFQDSDSQLFMSTVYEDVAFGPRNYGYSNIEVEEKVRNALRKVKIEKLKDLSYVWRRKEIGIHSYNFSYRTRSYFIR